MVKVSQFEEERKGRSAVETYTDGCRWYVGHTSDKEGGIPYTTESFSTVEAAHKRRDEVLKAAAK